MVSLSLIRQNLMLTNCLQRQIHNMINALPEILVWCEKYLDKQTDDEDDNEVIHILEIIDTFKRINTVLHKDDVADVEFSNQVLGQLFSDDENKEHLHIPVSYYISPTMRTLFIFRCMIS